MIIYHIKFSEINKETLQTDTVQEIGMVTFPLTLDELRELSKDWDETNSPALLAHFFMKWKEYNNGTV